MDACAATPTYLADSGFPRGVPSFSLAALVGTRLHCACSSKQGSKTWKAAQASLMNGNSAGGPVNPNDQEGNVVDDIAVLLSSCERLKSMIDSPSSSGVGPDMRNRVEHLLKRVGTLKQSAEVAARVAGGRVPSQLIASLKALQREHGSIENIVRLATQAGPVLTQQESAGLSVVAPKGILSTDYKPDCMNVELAQRQDYEAVVEVLSGPKYVMSTPSSEDSFKLTAVRAEIERRVMEQLTKKQGLHSIFESRQNVRKEDESKLIESQIVPSVKQRSLGDKSNMDEFILTGKGFLPQMVEDEEVVYSTPSDPMHSKNKAQFDTGQREMETAKMIPLEVHEQMVKNFERAVFDLRRQLSEVTDDVRKRDDTVLALKEELINEQSKLSKKMNELSGVTDDLKEREDTVLTLKEELIKEQSKLSKKMNELSGELMKRFTAEQLNHTLGKFTFDMEEDLKRTQSQLSSFSSELHNKEKMLVGCQKEQERIRQELQASICSLESRLRQREVMYEGFSPESVLAELGSFKVKLDALQEGQFLEQSQMADWQAKVEHFEKSVWSNAQQLKNLTSEVEHRMREGEVKNVLNKVLDAVDKQSKKLQEHVEHISAEQARTASSLGLLQQEWSAHRRELQMQIEDLKDQFLCLERTQKQGVLTEVSNINERLSHMQEEQNHQRTLISEAQQQMVVLEGNGLEDLKDQLFCLERTQNQGVMTEVSNINERLSHMQEEQKHQRTLISEAQQQMVVLEGNGMDILRKMREDAEVQKQDLLEEVQKLVDDLLRSSTVHQTDGNKAALSIDESNAIPKDVGHTGDLVNCPSSYALSTELSATISKNEQHEATLQEGSRQVHDKGTASLEAFFSVMGQLIREELKRMDRTSAQTPSLSELHKPGKTTQDGESLNETIVLRYDSSWKNAFIHFCADNLGWTDVPGVPMQEANNCDGKCWKEFRIKAARLEFVVTDGQGNWDRAPNGLNYLLEKPGIFELGAGVLKLAST